MSLEFEQQADEPREHIVLDGRRISLQFEEPLLPSNPRSRSVCEQHKAGGRFDVEADSWLAGGCVYPDENESPEIICRLVCPGPGWLRDCRLRIDQYNERGEKIGGILSSLFNLKTVFFVPDSKEQT